MKPLPTDARRQIAKARPVFPPHVFDAAACAAIRRDPHALPRLLFVQCAIDAAWQGVRSSLSARHPYHREALPTLGALANQVGQLVRPAGHHMAHSRAVDGASSWGPPDPLSGAAVAAYVSAQIAWYADIADSPQIVRVESYCMEAWQHSASGLGLIVCEPDNVDPGTGYIYSLQDRLPHEGKNPDNFRGLGIGYRLYSRAAAEHPDWRWGAQSAVSDMAWGVRRRLHREDPWRWKYRDCAWCANHLGAAWELAPRAAFRWHP